MIVAGDGGAAAPLPPPVVVAGPAPVDANGIPISAGFYGLGPGATLFPVAPAIDPVYQPPAAATPSPSPAAAAQLGLGPPVQFFGTPAQAAAAYTPTAFQGESFPAGGGMVAGGGGVGPSGIPSGVLAFSFAPAAAWSQSSREQLATLPSVPHAGVRPSLGGIGRVLAGLGLAGPHRLPRDLEREAGTRTPLTP